MDGRMYGHMDGSHSVLVVCHWCAAVVPGGDERLVEPRLASSPTGQWGQLLARRPGRPPRLARTAFSATAHQVIHRARRLQGPLTHNLEGSARAARRLQEP
jgi:hypothetical protein